jgi:hypothetical protein
LVTTGKRGREIGIGGDGRTDAEQILCADDNGDLVVSDAEFLNALGRIEATKELGLNGSGVPSFRGAGGPIWHT